MAFSLPTFPITCNIYNFSGGVLTLRLGAVPCNLAVGKRVQIDGLARGSDGAIGAAPSLLLPPGTDIRDLVSSTSWDIVEVPSGSTRWYQVSCVEQVGLGFDNHHVIAAITKASGNIDGGAFPGLIWPTPDTP